MEVILIEGKILDKKLPFQISYFSDNVGKISGYDRYDLLDQDFLKSRIHPEERKESLCNKIGLGNCFLRKNKLNCLISTKKSIYIVNNQICGVKKH